MYAPTCACSQSTPSYTCTLKFLDLRGNEVGPDGATALADALTSSGNATLALLNLNGNPIGDRGGLAIAAYLEVSCLDCC